MSQKLAHVAIVVSDYDEAIEYYTKKLGFVLVENTKLSDTKRWVVVAPPRGNGCSLLLAKAANEKQQSRIGDQTGGRVFLFLHTDDFRGDYERMKKAGVEFTEEPRREPYGWVVVFKDLYGNKWDLIEKETI
ncbi:VOC family protein [bacterium]|nr:MAG: VOC family protein [bacterium]